MSHINDPLDARRLALLLLAEGALRSRDYLLMSSPANFHRLLSSSVFLARHLDSDVFDAHGASNFLGVASNSVVSAAYRRRISFVQFGAGRLFARADLSRYAADRGVSKTSRLKPRSAYVVRLDDVWEIGPDGKVLTRIPLAKNSNS